MKGRILTSLLTVIALTGFQAQNIPAVPRLVVGLTNPTLAKAVRRLGYIPIGWNIRTLDTQQPTPEKIIKRIKKRLVPGSILLLHDRMPDSDRLLVQVLDFIEKEGYTVVALDRLIKQIT